MPPILRSRSCPYKNGARAADTELDRLLALRRRLPSRQSETSSAKEAQPFQVHADGTSKPQMEFGPHPMLEALRRGLSEEARVRLSGRLFRIVHGDPPERVRRGLEKVFAGCAPGQQPPRELMDEWLRRLSQEDAEERRLYALRCALAAGLPDGALRLQLLRTRQLPPRLRQEVAALCEEMARRPQ